MAADQQRVWLITGASSGFGLAIAEAALAAGDIVVAAARRPDAMAELVESSPDRVTALQLDVTDADRITAAVAEVLDRHGRVDVLVNNAGRGSIGAAEEATDAELRDLMDLHFFGPAALSRAVLPQMRAFNGPGALLISEPIADYDEQIQPLRTDMPEDDGKQPGDPAKAAQAILQALDSPEPPLRLALGNDAVDGISEVLDQAELAAWERVGRAAVFGGGLNAG